MREKILNIKIDRMKNDIICYSNLFIKVEDISGASWHLKTKKLEKYIKENHEEFLQENTMDMIMGVIVILANIANADYAMCNMYWNKLVSENKKLTKAININNKRLIKRQYQWLIYYAEYVQLECRAGKRRSNLATETISYCKTQLKGL